MHLVLSCEARAPRNKAGKKKSAGRRAQCGLCFITQGVAHTLTIELSTTIENLRAERSICVDLVHSSSMRTPPQHSAVRPQHLISMRARESQEAGITWLHKSTALSKQRMSASKAIGKGHSTPFVD